MKKYYTPTIEEFHAGFECEVAIPPLGKWEKHTILPYENFKGIQELLYSKDKAAGIRVKCLDKEDIEELGWEWIDENTFYIKKDSLSFNPDNHYLTITRIIGNTMGTYFHGTIKNKSELKTLMSWQNIK